MNSSSKQVLVVSEGHTEVRLLKRLFEEFNLLVPDIVSLNANLYRLYLEYESYECDYSDLDITAVLRSCSQVGNKDKEKLRGKSATDFSDIFLVFDLDPHTPDFNEDGLRKLLSHFKDSSDVGKLYINYPMVESFYHVPHEVLDGTMRIFPPIQFTLSELTAYKKRVNSEGIKQSRQYTQDEYKNVIQRHAGIVSLITGASVRSTYELKVQVGLFEIQQANIKSSRQAIVVNTFCLLIPEIYPSRCPLEEIREEE